MVPDRPTTPTPTLIVKAASDGYPGLAANEFLCLSAACRAGIDVPGFELSDDGQMLVLDRFDLREDRTLALKLFAGKGQTRAYPTTERLLEFGRRVCDVSQPAIVLRRIADAMSQTLQAARTDERIPMELLASMAEVWSQGMVHAAP